jgi:hypothetical protein
MIHGLEHPELFRFFLSKPAVAKVGVVSSNLIARSSQLIDIVDLYDVFAPLWKPSPPFSPPLNRRLRRSLLNQ